MVGSTATGTAAATGTGTATAIVVDTSIATEFAVILFRPRPKSETSVIEYESRGPIRLSYVSIATIVLEI